MPCGFFCCAQLKKYFTFEVTVLDDKNVHRRFRASNYQVRRRAHLASPSSTPVRHGTLSVVGQHSVYVARVLRLRSVQSTTRVKPFICTMPMRLDDGWNQIQFNLSDFTRRAYGTNYIETLRVQIHANCRIRWVACGLACCAGLWLWMPW